MDKSGSPGLEILRLAGVLTLTFTALILVVRTSYVWFHYLI
jgi:hypothetical protein